MKRREFLQGSLAATAAMGLQFYGVPALAKSGSRKKMIVIFLRGGADMLGMFPPTLTAAQQANYKNHPLYGLRGVTEEMAKNFLFSTKVGSTKTTAALKVSDHPVMFHPNFAPLKSVIASDNFLVIPHTASMHDSRSHFEQQDMIESGSKDRKLNVGYLARAAGMNPGDERISVALGAALPKSLGGYDAPLLAKADDMKSNYFVTLNSKSRVSGVKLERSDRLELFKHTDNDVNCEQSKFCSTVTGAQANYDALQGEIIAFQAKAADNFGKQCELAAFLTQSKFNPPIITIDLGGWDHHINENPTDPKARMGKQVDILAAGLKILADEMSKDTVVVVMSEFGRTAVANPSMGTDHGRGSAMIVMGAPVSRKGYKDLTGWDLTKFDGTASSRALLPKIDNREITAEIIERHLGVSLKNDSSISDGIVKTVFDDKKTYKRRSFV